MKKITLIMIIVIITLLSGCTLFPKEEEALAPPLIEPKREEYKLYEVKREDIINYVKGSATVVASESSPVFFKTGNKRLKSIDVTYGQEIKTGDIIARLDPGDFEYQLELNQISYDKLIYRYEQLKSEYENAKESQKASLKKQLDLLEFDVELETLKFDHLKASYESTILRAPMDGVVTYIEYMSEGDYVNSYKTICVISKLDDYSLYYKSKKTSQVKTGMDVVLEYKDVTYNGKVVMSPENAPLDAKEQMKDAIVIEPETPIKDLELGKNVQFTIAVEQSLDTIVIPRSALRVGFGDEIVRILDGDSKIELNVETGLSTSTKVEILDGLEVGQQVILN